MLIDASYTWQRMFLLQPQKSSQHESALTIDQL